MTENPSQKALDELKYIKKMISGAGQFTSLSGLAWMIAGVLALVATGLSIYLTGQFSLRGIHKPEVVKIGLLWGVALVVAMMVDFILVSRLSRQWNQPDYYRFSYSALSKKMRLLFFLTLVIGGVFTIQYWLEGLFFLAPTAWMLIFGLALFVGGLFSLLEVRVLGCWFMLCGLVSGLILPGYSFIGLGSSFGVGLLVCGFLIRRKIGEIHREDEQG